MAVSRVNGGRGGRSEEAEVACEPGIVFVVVSVMMEMKSSIAETAASVPLHCATRPCWKQGVLNGEWMVGLSDAANRPLTNYRALRAHQDSQL